MDRINLEHIRSSVYNSEIILTLIAEKDSLAPYRIAKVLGKEQQRTIISRCCESLEDRGLLDLKNKDTNVENAVYYSLNYRELTYLFFDYFKNELSRVLRDEDSLIFQELFMSKTISLIADNTLSQKIEKDSLESFFDSVYLIMQGMSINNMFISILSGNKSGMEEVFMISKKKAKMLNFIMKDRPDIGFYIDELKGILPRAGKTFSELFKMNPYIDKVRKSFNF